MARTSGPLQFRYKSNGEVVVARMRDLAKRIADPTEVLDDFGMHMVESSIPANFKSGGRPDKWPESRWQLGDRSQIDTGGLMRSVTYNVTSGKLEVGTAHKAAAQRHFGGKITAGGSKAIPVPMPDLPRSMRRPRHWGDRLFRLEPQKKGDTVGLLASKDDDGGITIRFVLRKSVTQPARPFLLFQDEDLVYVSKRMAEYVVEGRLAS